MTLLLTGHILAQIQSVEWTPLSLMALIFTASSRHFYGMICLASMLVQIQHFVMLTLVWEGVEDVLQMEHCMLDKI